MLERELAVLPRLALHLPVPIPLPAHIGQPSELYPWPFFGARLLPGREAADADLDDDARAELGSALGRFLRTLHAPGTWSRVDPERVLPLDPLGRADMAQRVPKAREFLAEVDAAGIWHTPRAALQFLSGAAELPRPTSAVFVHGDLHLRHVLVESNVLTGVIDWGDACIGDPSIDLQIA